MITTTKIKLLWILLASSSYIWSLFAQHHTLTKRKGRSIASQITSSIQETYLVIILHNSYQKLTKSKIRLSWESFRTLLKITHLSSRKSYLVIICLNSYEKFTNQNLVKLESVRTFLKITQLPRFDLDGGLIWWRHGCGRVS